MLYTLSDLIPEDEVSGTGLIIRDGDKYLFMLPGHNYGYRTSDFIYFAGIGGKRKKGESFIDCVKREVREEVELEVELISSDNTYYLDREGKIGMISLDEDIKPLLIFEKFNPADADWNRSGRDWIYYVVIYISKLIGSPKPHAELGGLIRLTRSQIIRSAYQKVTLGELLSEGAELIEKISIPKDILIYPVGTPEALVKLWDAYPEAL